MCYLCKKSEPKKQTNKQQNIDSERQADMDVFEMQRTSPFTFMAF